MKYPKVYLSIDNCFASKRWTRPRDWMEVIRSCGVNCVESSADTECDMLYSDRDYLAQWRREVLAESERNGMRVVSTYTGHGTYATLGLTHTDPRCRDRMLRRWLLPHIDNAAALGCMAGFYCHAFDETVVQSPTLYEEYRELLRDSLKETAVYAAERGVLPVLEQMYSPQQYPWRIEDARRLMREVSDGGTPLYLTIDTGHQYGQRRFEAPTGEAIFEAIAEKRPLYVGSERSRAILEEAQAGRIGAAEAAEAILTLNREDSRLFADREDGDTWAWLRELGRYSPLIHLQQTDNTSSSHRDFSPQSNRTGCITGEKLLLALRESYERPDDPSMPPPVDELYLTLELFYSNAATGHEIRKSLQTSVGYWRRFVPQDGLTLDRLTEGL